MTTSTTTALNLDENLESHDRLRLDIAYRTIDHDETRSTNETLPEPRI